MFLSLLDVIRISSDGTEHQSIEKIFLLCAFGTYRIAEFAFYDG